MKKFALGILLISIFSCNSKHEENSAVESEPMILEEIRFPGNRASEPNLTVGPDGTIYLSWIEDQNDNSTLKYARLNNGNWVSETQIASGDNWFVNWADFPSMIALESGYAAHFLAYISEGKYSYGVNLASSKTGKDWNNPVMAHDDNTPTEHGFVTLLPMSRENYLAVWLDGRNYVDSEHKPATKEMSLRCGLFDLDGNKLEEHVIDSRVCDCCQTDGAISSRGPVIVYRDRGLMEVRDIFISRFENGEWKEPWIVHPDEWEIPGCPVNGPAVDASGSNISVAWFTAARGTRKVLVSFSGNDGDQFGEPVRIDLGNPLGRVDLIQFDNFTAVTWMEENGETAFIYCRKIFRDGTLGEVIPINETDKSRSSGFPRMTRDKESLIFAWTVPGEVSTIQTVKGNFTY